MKPNLVKLAVVTAIAASSQAYALSPPDCSNEESWTSSKAYVGGSMVSFENAIYKANWWTQGQDPATNSDPYEVWSKTQDCNDFEVPKIDIQLNSPTANAKYKVGDQVNMSVEQLNDEEIAKVVFEVNGETVAEDATAPYQADWQAAAKGSFTVKAIAYPAIGGVESDQETANITVTEDDIIDPPKGDFKVVGYFPSWQGSVSNIQFDKLTHVNYSFLLPNADGSLQPLAGLAKFQQLITAAHAEGTKVGIAVGGWNGGNDSAFETLAANPTTRTAFVNNLIAFVEQYDVDGVDMDWEYPDPGTSADNFAAMMNELATELHARGKFLSAAVVSEGYTGGGVLPSVFDDIDFLNLMAYDANNADHSTYQLALDSINYWQGRGLPKEKTVLGVPFYSRPTWKAYNTLVAENPANACRDTDGTSYYNGIPTIRAKAQLALDKAGGIMNWELSHDTNGANSLLTAKYEVVNGLAQSYDCDGDNTDTDTDTDTDTGTGTPLCSSINVDPSSYNAHPNWPQNDWSGTPSHALGGDRMTYNGTVFEAKWWTNSVPGSDTTWNTICSE